MKRSRVVDREHLERVKGMACIICGAWPPSDAHHIRTRPDGQHYGTGQKAGDDETIPLCNAHHQTGPDAYHAGPRTFTARFGDEMVLLERTLAILDLGSLE